VLAELAEIIPATIDNAAEVMKSGTGRVIVTGVGKSAAVARVAAATLTTAGVPSVFLHANDAVHGELGLLCRSDVVMALSLSGRTGETLAVAEHAARLGVPLVAVTARSDSPLARLSDAAVVLGEFREAGSAGLLPTTSVIATLAVIHAITMCITGDGGSADLLDRHPAGSLGDRLRQQRAAAIGGSQ
jgi:arabinose-5-phosphate isomerase